MCSLFIVFLAYCSKVPFIVSLGIQNGQFLDVPYFLRVWMVVDRLRLFLNLRVDVSPAGRFDAGCYPCI